MTKRDTYPLVAETYIDPENHILELQKYGDRPDAFNGVVRIHRYRVTAERIEDSKEVLVARLRALWRTCPPHRMQSSVAEPLKRAADELGIKLDPAQLGVEWSKP